MGYTTKFSGCIELSRELTFTEAKQLLELAEDSDHETDLPGTRPGSYLQWVPTTDLRGIVWDGGEKFYNYAEWMVWVCKVLADWGIEADGTLMWQGEETGDVGTLIVAKNSVTTNKGRPAKRSNRSPMTLDELARKALDAATA